LENFGRGAFVRAIPAEVKAYATQQYARPNLGYAEGERGQLDRLVNPPQLTCNKLPHIRPDFLLSSQREPYFTGLMAIISRAWLNPSFIS
jgi:hypothetical protein